ncbi:hypothetical protein ACSSV8_000983 [Roseovarius sp. MBR-79]
MSVEAMPDGALRARVSNGRGQSYQQRMTLDHGLVDGMCSCPVGYNCKHVAAALVTWDAEQGGPRRAASGLAAPVQGWLRRIKESTAPTLPEMPPEDYPDTVKERLLYVLMPQDPKVKIDIYKGRINAAGTALNRSIRRYDALRGLQGATPAKFIRPLDLDLLAALAQARLWEAHYSYGLPDLIRPKGKDVLTLIQRLCDTGRFLHDNAPEAHLACSAACPTPRLAWQMAADGNQRLGFEDESGQPLELRGMDGDALWLDKGKGQIGALAQAVDTEVLHLVAASPEIAPHEAGTLATALPATLGGLDLPPPAAPRQIRRAATQRIARLTLGAETARDGSRYWGNSVLLPTLTVRFVYDGQEAPEDGDDPRRLEEGQIVTLARDPDWERACATTLMRAGALRVEELEFHWPGERMMTCDFVFADGEMNMHSLEISTGREALDFAFRTLPALRRDGWEVIKTPRWPFRLSPLAPLLHLFLTHHAELGALHPSDATVARLVEEALAGNDIRFADKAGVLPLARSLQTLAEAKTFEAPKGLKAQLRDYQAYGAAWMGNLLAAGFGGVLADDMGLGKTVFPCAETVPMLLWALLAAGQITMRKIDGWQTLDKPITPMTLDLAA